MTKPRVLLTKEILQGPLEELKYYADLVPFDKNKSLQSQISDIDGLICMLSDQIDSTLLDHALKLKVIANYAVGFNNIDIEAAKSNNVVVTNTPDALTHATADLAFGLLLSVSRCLPQANKAIFNNEWTGWESKKFLGPELNGKTLGIYGLGRIGAEMAKRAEAFGMNIIYHNRNKKPCKYTYVNFEQLIEKSEVISLHAPLNASSYGIFNKATFSKMKKGSIFINTARGEMHDEDALYQALQSGHLFAAGLDVTNPEPCSKDSKLLHLPNCFITPHIGSASFEARTKMVEICVRNVLNVLRGDDPITPVY